MKAKREHEVPLSDAALALLESMPKEGEIVFPSTKDLPLSDMLLTASIRPMMVKADLLRVPARLPAKLLQHESLQLLAQRSAILHQRVGVKTEQGAGEPCVADVQFRSDVPGGG